MRLKCDVTYFSDECNLFELYIRKSDGKLCFIKAILFWVALLSSIQRENLK
jgi:hypothetical protein